MVLLVVALTFSFYSFIFSLFSFSLLLTIFFLIFTFLPNFRSQLSTLSSESNQNVVATAKGCFNHQGGILTSEETGVSLVIPPGALAEGVEQEIYFKVCRDTSMLPPLDQEKGILN